MLQLWYFPFMTEILHPDMSDGTGSISGLCLEDVHEVRGSDDDTACHDAFDTYRPHVSQTDVPPQPDLSPKDGADTYRMDKGGPLSAIGSVVVTLDLQYSSPSHAAGTQPPENSGRVAPAEALRGNRSLRAGHSRLGALVTPIALSSLLVGGAPAPGTVVPRPPVVEAVAAGPVVPTTLKIGNVAVQLTHNWAGIQFQNGKAFNGAGANLGVPGNIGCEGSEKLSEWVAIIGTDTDNRFHTRPLIQEGFQADCVLLGGNQPVLAGINLFMEAFPAGPIELGTVREGETVNAYITYIGKGKYAMRLSAGSEVYTKDLSLPSGVTTNGEIAAVMMERDKQGSQNYPLAPFSSSTVQLVVRQDGSWRFPNSFPAADVFMTDDNGRVKVAGPSGLMAHGKWNIHFIR
jgi:hypothetical protein